MNSCGADVAGVTKFVQCIAKAHSRRKLESQISQAGVEVSDGLERSVDGHAREGGRTGCADERPLVSERNL